MPIRPAIIEDVPHLVQFIKDLADYENALDEEAHIESLHQIEVTEELLEQALFGPTPALFAHVAEHQTDEGPRVVGMAIWFLNFSTLLGRHGIYVEDLYVHPEFRGFGYGKALFRELAKICVDRGYGRFEWWVVDWNDSAIDFYKRLGAFAMDEFTVYRLTGEALQQLGSAK